MPTTDTSQPGPSPEVRAEVRALLQTCADFHTLDAQTKKAIAGSMVRIADTAKALAAEAGEPVHSLNGPLPAAFHLNVTNLV